VEYHDKRKKEISRWGLGMMGIGCRLEEKRLTKESIIDQTYSFKISPDPSFPKRGNSSLL
jgi:hypothetical protein